MGKIYLIEERANPSTDYFVLPALAGAKLVRCGFTDLPAISELDGAIVIFVRYLPSAWVELIDQARSRLSGLIFFMDDDLLDVRASTGMPLRYRIKLWRHAARREKWLRQQGAELWVSTSQLQTKYQSWRPRLVLPAPLPEPSGIRQIFYHGSASHFAEIQWLRPVIEEAVKRDESVAFELIGGAAVNRLYRDLPRVRVVHPMRWPAYQAFLATPGRHVGLAPLLNSQFNDSRSYTKFFDITRCGAVGVYSADSIFAEVVTRGENGMLVGQDQDAWLNALLELAHNEPLRLKMLDMARKTMAAMADRSI